MQQTKLLRDAEPKLQAAIALHDKILTKGDLVAVERELLGAKAKAEVMRLHEIRNHELASLAEYAADRKKRTQLHGERRLIPNRDLCEQHRPRLCKYTESRFGASAVCGRVFTLADGACKAGGICCEDTVQIP